METSNCKIYLLKNGDAEPELEEEEEDIEDVLNESWSESPPIIPFPEQSCLLPLKPIAALPFDEGDEGMFPPAPNPLIVTFRGTPEELLL